MSWNSYGNCAQGQHSKTKDKGQQWLCPPCRFGISPAWQCHTGLGTDPRCPCSLWLLPLCPNGAHGSPGVLGWGSQVPLLARPPCAQPSSCHFPLLPQPFLCLYQPYNPAANPFPLNKSPLVRCQRLNYCLYFPSVRTGCQNSHQCKLWGHPRQGEPQCLKPSNQASGSLHVQNSVFKKTAIKICLRCGSHRGQCNKSTPKTLISPRGSCQTCTAALAAVLLA